MPRKVSLPGPADLVAAREAVSARLAATPRVPSALVGGELKLETLQPTGAFKVRGALAALTRMDPSVDAITASAGNHGLGVAWAAAALGRRATIVVPETASPAKVAALREFGARLVQHGRGYDEAEAHALERAASGDALFLSAYNDRDVIAGQATIGAELPPGPLCVVCPVGGGGLVAGLALWARERGDARVVGVEAAASRAVSAAVAAGEVVHVEVGETLADGLAGNLEPGSVTPRAAALAELTYASEDEIAGAMRDLASRQGLVAEGAAAAAVAAVTAGRVRARPGERLVVVLTGRNVALPALARVLASGPSPTVRATAADRGRRRRPGPGAPGEAT